mmetsp:Transcript_391/g.500  ORF Transcript_391/g.500 Transcript_391/m.500 type:complete len:238 (+) Transcript_391:36-749(+)|eukprot:CAMPEP_0201544474 /NCGR_PEP_ID=MMETSP0173_2-20130828/1092_1 /ASSEMBLY_ACC=CAM_ASM_000268 /TAXON_ID=218659 /ORGANISM="Vexillifera sp., Strain DIVA3 564/2" /LENGTH=237 /DNA_ID=CAMNT_0047952601 /DNA_START=36 /DNA_END=749 /DNA_ORIENTATION=-
MASDAKTVKIGDIEYTLATDEKFEEFRQFATGDDGWEEVYTDDAKQTHVYRKKAGSSSVNMFKLTRPMEDIKPETLYDVLHDHNYRKVWDENMLSGIVIEQMNKTNEVGYYAAKSPGPISNRDFVNQRCWRALPDKGEWLIINWSVKHHEYPEQKGFVRAISILSGYYITKHSSGGTFFTYVTQTDPKGWIPSWVVNSVTGKFAPRVADTLHEVAQKYPEWKKENQPEWRPWLDEKE